MSNETTIDRICVTVSGKPRAIVMSWNLQRELLSIMPSLDDLPRLGSDPKFTSDIFVVLLSVRNEAGLTVEEFNFEKEDLSYAEAQRLIDWVADFMADFTLRQLKRGQLQAEKIRPVLTNLIQLNSGLKA